MKTPKCKRDGSRAPSSVAAPVAARRPGSRSRSKKAIVQDTRERKPFGFKGYRVKKKALNVGDYSVDGFENVIAIERKSGPDLVNTMMGGKARFERELQRAKAKGMKLVIVVECSMAGLASALGYSNAPRRAIITRLLNLSLTYDCPVFFCDNKSMAEMVTLEILRPYVGG